MAATSAIKSFFTALSKYGDDVVDEFRRGIAGATRIGSTKAGRGAGDVVQSTLEKIGKNGDDAVEEIRNLYGSVMKELKGDGDKVSLSQVKRAFGADADEVVEATRFGGLDPKKAAAGGYDTVGGKPVTPDIQPQGQRPPKVDYKHRTEMPDMPETNPNNLPAVVEAAPYSNAPARVEMNMNQAKGQFGYSTIKNQELYNVNRSTMQKIKDKLSEIWGGSRFNRKTTNARKAYNTAVNQAGGSSYIKSNRQYRNMAREMGFHGNKGYQGMDFTNAMSGAGLNSGAEITGEMMYGFNKVNSAMEEMTEAAKRAAQKNVENASNALDGIAGFMKEHELITAGALVGGGLLLGNMLDDD